MRALVAAMLFAGCIGSITSSAAATRHYFYATCQHEIHGFLGFNGRRHVDIADAQSDCADHRKTYPRHPCTVRPVDY